MVVGLFVVAVTAAAAVAVAPTGSKVSGASDERLRRLVLGRTLRAVSDSSEAVARTRRRGLRTALVTSGENMAAAVAVRRPSSGGTMDGA